MLSSIASLLAASIYQESHDRNHKLYDVFIFSVTMYSLIYEKLHIYLHDGNFMSIMVIHRYVSVCTVSIHSNITSELYNVNIITLY